MADTESPSGQHPRYSELQVPIASLPDNGWDVVVVGTGPSGSTCARLLAQKGLRVLAIDKEHFPRHKVCGDLLVPDALAMLRKIGAFDRVAAIAYKSSRIEVSSPSGIRFEVPGEYLTLSRKRLDYELLRHAVEAGAVAAAGNVTNVLRTDHHSALLQLDQGDRPLRAKIVVLATGGVVDLAYRMGIVSRKDPSAIAVRCYVRSPHRGDNTIISYDRSILPGYGWVIPLGQDPDRRYLYNVGCGTSYRYVVDGHHHLKKTLKTFLESFDPAREIMDGAETISPVAGASLRCGIEQTGGIGAGGIMGIGETIGTTYPFTGEGIGKGMETGALAADVISKALRAGDIGSLEVFKGALDTLRPRYEGYEIAERWLGKPWLNDLVSRRITRSRYLQHKVQKFMAETDSPRSLFNIWSLLNSWFR